MATNLTASITDLFVLQSGSPPFIPDLSAASGHWVIGLNFVPSGASFHEPVGVAIDAGGNVWAANYLGDSVTELSLQRRPGRQLRSQRRQLQPPISSGDRLRRQRVGSE